MDTCCCIIPGYLLNTIVEKGTAPQHVVHACQSTLEKTKLLQSSRVEAIASAQRQQPPEGIIPPYIHETIARTAATVEEREAALFTLTRDAKHHTVARPMRQLNRTVYNSQHSWDDPPPRDKIAIKEGGALISEAEDPTKDANECYIGLKKTYDFFFKFFQRNSINNRGMPLDSFVHFGMHFKNAFWNGRELVFGNGDGIIFNGFTDELDVMAHEYTHGVVQYTSPLDYTFQSGSLNESLADVFGIMVKQYAENPDNPQTVDQSNWLIGEGIWAAGVNGRALRDMKNPGTAYDDDRIGKDDQPAHWRDFKKLDITQDSGGVHINSGIPNRAFYLAATKIGGYAWEGAGPIWYKTLTSGKLGRNATFKEFADITIENAGKHGDEIKEAWQFVGYPFPDSRSEL